jgi:asparagine synthase (glutamine-hydrolysing)
MPGFAGIFGSGHASLRLVGAMGSGLSRRAGDGVGSYASPDLPLHLAWVDRDASVTGVRGVWNASADIGLWLYGDVFVGDRGGADHVLRLYEERGDEFVASLDGWFSGVLVDRRRRCAWLFNDRFGVGRVYVAQTNEGLAFATQAQALLAAFPQCRRIDLGALGETFAYGCVLRDRTLFPGVSLLPCASRWSLAADGRVEPGSYFAPSEWEQQQPLPAAQFSEELRDTFCRVLPRYLNGKGLAMSLTGGLDGRMIMAWAGAAANLPCYSFGGPYRDCHDVRIARAVAQTCGQTHQVIRVGADMLRDFPALAQQCVQVSGGTMDVSGAVELYVNREARGIAPIRLTGNYGSEIVRGYVAFRPGRLPMSFYEPAFARHVEAAGGLYAHERCGRDLSFIAFKQVPWFHHARAAVERSQLDVRSPFLDNALVRLMYRAPAAELRDRRATLQVIHQGNPRLSAIATDRGYKHGPTTIVDQARQAVLDFSAKAEYAYDYGMPNRLSQIDRVLGFLRLERLFLGRHKFYHFRTWYRRELADYVQDILLSPRARARSPYRQGVLETMVRRHVRGTENHTDEIHRALTHELIHRSLIDDAAYPARA